MSLSEGQRVKLVYMTALVFLIVLISGAFQIVKTGLPVQQDNITGLASVEHSEALTYRIASQVLAIRHTSNEKTFRKKIGQLDAFITSLEGEYRQIQRIKAPSGWKKLFYPGSEDTVGEILAVLHDQLEEFILKAKNFRTLSFQHSQQQDSLLTDISRIAMGDLSRVFTQTRVIFQRRIDATTTLLSWIITLLWGLTVGVLIMVAVVIFRVLLKKVTLMNEVLRTEYAMLQDEKQELEEQLRKRDATVFRFEQLFELTSDGHLIVMKDNSFMMNHPLIDMLEIPDPLVESKDYDQLRQFLMLSFTRGEIFGRHFQELNNHLNDSSYFTLNHKDGRQMECRTEPLYSEDEMIGRVWIFRDITEYLSFKSNRHTTGELSQFSSTPPGGMASIFHELNGNIIEADINALQLFGFSHEELLGKNIKTLFPTEAIAEIKQRYREISKHKHYHFEARFVRHNGKMFSAQVAANMINIHDTRVVHLLIDLLQFHPNGHKESTTDEPSEKNLSLEPSS